MSKEKGQGEKMLSYELPWPKELSQGMVPGLIWTGMSFMMFMVNWTYGMFSVAAMFIFFQTQRNTPVGRGRRYYVRGRLAYKQQNIEEALTFFYESVKVMPEAAAIYPVIGDLHFMQGDIPKAKNAYQQYFQRKAEDYPLRMWYAGKLMEVSLFTEAATELKKLPAVQRKNNQVVNLLAVCLLKLNQAKEALQILESVAKNEGIDEQQLSARYLLAKAYQQQGEKEKALRILKKLEQDHPGFEDVPQLIHSL